MSIDHLVRNAFRLLDGLESGNLNGADAYQIADDLEPFLLYQVFQFLREKYPASSPNSQGVLTRLVELSGTYPKIVDRIKAGEKDILTEWFRETYAYREYFGQPESFIELLVEKLEG